MDRGFRKDSHQKPANLGRRRWLVSALTAVGGFVLGWLTPGGRQDRLLGVSDDLDTQYHQWGKLDHSAISATLRDWGQRPERYKTYPGAERIALPDPRGYQGESLDKTLELRRSRREYADSPLSLEELSRLLHAAQGITDGGRGLRVAPSAGALYPIELYPVVHDVASLEPGIYHFAVQDHELELIQQDEFRNTIQQAGLGQAHLGEANVCFVLSAIFQRTRWKYRKRAYRYVLLEAGHIGQNLYLAAVSMGLGACAVGAFRDDDLNQLLGLDGTEEASLYIVAVGKV